MVLFFYYIVAKEYRNWVLLFFSLVFYGWGEGRMLTIMMVSVLLNYFFGLGLENARTEFTKKLTLFFGIASNLSLLLYYKYANFFIDNYNFAASKLGVDPVIWDKVVLPLGISFYTFHGISYMIDVYRLHVKPQRNPLKLALYISFFPQLIAGPIIRYKDVQDQIDHRAIDVELFASGIKRFIIGLAKKVLIANIAGRVPEFVFKMPENQLTGYYSWLAMLAVSIQIYFDFSGYSDMAIGMGRMFGFRFLENFNYPIISQSMKEFWTRWHISLSNFFRDYVYLPLGGNKKGKFRMYLSLWTIFLLNGIWHGPNWNFLLFGVYHGAWLTLERLGFSRILEMFPRWLRSFYVFLAFAFGNIIFSIEDLHHIGTFYRSLFNFSTIADPFSRLYLYTSAEFYFIIIIGSFLFFPCVEYVFKKIRNERIKPRLEAGLLIVLFILSLSELANSSYNPFIYFRF